MALRCTTAKGTRVATVRPSAGVEAVYYRSIMRLVRAMQDDVARHVASEYRRQESEITLDESPVRALQRIMSTVTAKWRTKFNDVSRELSRRFVENAQGHADRKFGANLAGEGFTVKFAMSEGVRTAVQASVAENVTLIKSIGEQHMSEVNQAVMRSVAAGRDLKTLTDELQERYGITRRRAAFIARDQNNKATATVNRMRQVELGLTEAIWCHSSAGKHPRPTHLKAGRDKLRYDIRKGAYLDGKWIHPGEEPNCRCTSSVIVPGFGD